MITHTIRDGIALTEEQREFVALARDFAEREIRPRAREVDEADTESPLDLWRGCLFNGGRPRCRS